MKILQRLNEQALLEDAFVANETLLESYGFDLNEVLTSRELYEAERAGMARAGEYDWAQDMAAKQEEKDKIARKEKYLNHKKEDPSAQKSDIHKKSSFPSAGDLIIIPGGKGTAPIKGVRKVEGKDVVIVNGKQVPVSLLQMAPKSGPKGEKVFAIKRG
jgi:hypothetical protein